MRAIIFIVRLANLALQTSPNLGSDSNAVSNIDRRNFVADFDCLANDLMSDAQREIGLSPTSSDGVNIGATDTTGLNQDIYIALLERLWFILETM